MHLLAASVSVPPRLCAGPRQVDSEAGSGTDAELMRSCFMGSLPKIRRGLRGVRVLVRLEGLGVLLVFGTRAYAACGG